MVAFAVAPAVAAVGMGALRSIPQVIPRLVGIFGRGFTPTRGMSIDGAIGQVILKQNQAARANAARGSFSKGVKGTSPAAKTAPESLLSTSYGVAGKQSASSKAVIDTVNQKIPKINLEQAMDQVNTADQVAYGLGRGLNAVSVPFGGPVGLGVTAAFTAPMFLPQGQSQPDEMYGYYPNGQYPVDPGMVQFQSLTDEQIVKARRRMEENAQLNAIYANALSQYEM